MANRGAVQTPESQRYALRCLNGNEYRVRLNGTDTDGFVVPATEQKRDKIYVVKEGNKIHYVGITRRAMAARMRDGFKATGIQGYHGYKFKGMTEATLELFVWSLPGAASEDSREHLETIEAEFAYLVRKKTDQWPISQNEIHFHPSEESHRQFATKMMEEMLEEPDGRYHAKNPSR
ncbi:MAG: hypothetical protein ACLPTF_25420 [Steroidobacteraceae bacterium]